MFSAQRWVSTGQGTTTDLLQPPRAALPSLKGGKRRAREEGAVEALRPVNLAEELVRLVPHGRVQGDHCTQGGDPLPSASDTEAFDAARWAHPLPFKARGHALAPGQ